MPGVLEKPEKILIKHWAMIIRTSDVQNTKNDKVKQGTDPSH